MTGLEVAVFIVCLSVVCAYINRRFLRLTPTIGITILSLAFTALLLALRNVFPNASEYATHVITSIDFHDLLMNYMLGLLLFAGSVHLDAATLRKQRWPVIVLSTAGVLISTFIVSVLLYYLFIAFGTGISYVYCLLFAALISPTDPIAVLAILKRAGLAKPLEIKIAGESLFNDGVAVVVFITILSVAQTGATAIAATDVMLLFLKQAGGGLLLGLLLGYLGYIAVRVANRYIVNELITILIVTGGYFLAGRLDISGPLAMVVAGIFIGSKGSESGISEVSKKYLHKFWGLIDEMLNAVLFLLVGLEILVVSYNFSLFITGLITIILVLFARWVSVAIPISFLRFTTKFERHTIVILTWGGLRGGLSIALALSLPAEMHKDEFVCITYMVVIFSIVVQGLTIGSLYKRLRQN